MMEHAVCTMRCVEGRQLAGFMSFPCGFWGLKSDGEA